jgi:hypothetical protein
LAAKKARHNVKMMAEAKKRQRPRIKRPRIKRPRIKRPRIKRPRCVS